MKQLLLLNLLLLSSAFIYGQTYQLNTANADLNWTGSAAFSTYTLNGTLSATSGSLTIEDDRLMTTNIVIDMKSLDAEIKDLRKHLRSADFFDVKKYPQAVFVLSETPELKEGELNFKGMFTIKETTKEESFTLNAQEENGHWTFKGKIILDRTAYGIYYNSPNFFKNLKQNAIADEIVLDLSLTFDAKS